MINKREAILTGAMEEFLAHGYAATSMDRLAARSGVSKATVYKYFRDKEELFNTLIEGLAREKFQTVFSLETTPSLEENPQEVLFKLALKMLKTCSSDRTLQNFMRIIIGESGRFPELAKGYIHNIAQPGIAALTQYFKDHPELNVKDSEVTARIFIGSLVYYVILQELLYGQEIMPLSKERLAETLSQIITPNLLNFSVWTK